MSQDHDLDCETAVVPAQAGFEMSEAVIDGYSVKGVLVSPVVAWLIERFIHEDGTLCFAVTMPIGIEGDARYGLCAISGGNIPGYRMLGENYPTIDLVKIEMQRIINDHPDDDDMPDAKRTGNVFLN